MGWEAGSELEASKKEKSLIVDCVATPSEIAKQESVEKMTYEEFRDRIKRSLQYNDRGMTWTQIRTQLKLDQVVPNNKWVRRMEKDMGLIRVKGKDGIVLWRISHVR